MRRIKNFKVLSSGLGAVVILAAVAIISAQVPAGKNSTYEQKIDKIMVDYVEAIQTAENLCDKKMAPFMKPARIARDSAIANAGLAVETKLTRAAKDSMRLGRPEGAKVAQEELTEIRRLTKLAQTTDPRKGEGEGKKSGNAAEAESGPLPAHVAIKGNAYIAILGEHTFPEASVICKRMGGRLVCIESAEELLFLQKQLPVNHTLWVGASDTRRKGNWRWLTGSAVNRACWGKDQPAKPHYSIRGKFWHSVYAALRTSGMVTCASTAKCKGFICEWDR